MLTNQRDFKRLLESILHYGFCRGGLFIVTVFLCACHDSTAHHLRFGLAAAPVSLDPRFATDATSSRINRLLYRTLIDFDDNLRPTPDLATWEQLSVTHYRFHLQDKGRQFHNNTRLTAQDVKATYEFILEAKNASPHRSSLSNIQQIHVRDADTIDFMLVKPDALFVGRLGVGIVPATLLQQNHPFNRNPIGSGEFRLLDWTTTSHLRLQRMRDGLIVEFLEVKDPVVRVLKLVRGELDLVQGDLSPELVTWLTTRPNIQVSQVQGSNFSYLGFNLQDPVTKQLAVRQAIAYALNRQEIIRYVLGNAARPANSLLIPTHWAGHADLPYYPYNPDQSRTLLAQAGFNAAHPVHLIYKTSNNPFRVRLATVIQQQLAEVGIIVDLRTYDWGTFYGDIKTGRFQMFSLQWVGVKMPDIFRYAFHSSAVPPNGANRGRLNNPEIDSLIEQAEQTPTLEQQAVLYRELQAYVWRELPYVPLWYEDHVLATRQWVKNYALATDGNYDGLNSVILTEKTIR